LPTETDVVSLGSAFADARDTATNDLQRNVYRNYTDFVVIGKEISKLESDMMVFRGLLHSLNEVSEHFRVLGGVEETVAVEQVRAPSETDEKRAQKAAAQLAEKHSVALKALYSAMEGLQKVLPESPGRYIVRDGISSRFTEVSSATYKDSKEHSYIYLLSDYLVVASWKKNLISGKNRFVVDKAWPLSEIVSLTLLVVIDLI
jgi:hypothetical protein